jgi:hypothetical protein
MAAYDRGSEPSTLDMLKGLALVAAFVGFLSTCAALIAWWDSTWREAVSPVRIEVYSARLGHSPCLFGSWWWWRSAGCRVA